MNHYPRHVGDFIRDTVGLSLAERGALSTLIDHYYGREKPLPLDVKQIHRMAGAMTKAERHAVEYVLGRFFTEAVDGWHQKRCDKEIALCLERSAKNSAFWNAIPRATRTAIEGARRAAKLNATPRWLTDDQLAEIAAIYEEARHLSVSTGEPHEVDHIVPLRGVAVCGLHVPWNLRPIPARANRAKGRAA